MTQREKYLTRLVENALGLPEAEVGHGNANVLHKLEKRDEPAPQGPTYSEGDGGEMVQPTIPEYRDINELLKYVEESTNKAAEETKIREMKRISELLREKKMNLEESEHADYINKKDINQLGKNIRDIDKAVAKLEAAFDKKFNKKNKPATAPKAEKEEPTTLAEGFDLRKFLVENKLTTSSRLIKENEEDSYDADFAAAKQMVSGATKLSSFGASHKGITSTAMAQHIAQTQGGKYMYWYYEPGEETGVEIVSPEDALQIVKAMNGEGEVPQTVPSGYAASLYFKK